MRTTATIDDRALEETIVKSTQAWKGRIFSIDKVDVTLPDGTPSSRDVLRHPGSVGIVALTDDSQIVLVHQYRTALERVTLEIPAGKLDPGEDALECAARELKEETGITAGKLRYLTAIAVAIGYSDEILHLYMATDLSFGEAHPDDGEFLRIELMPLVDLVDLVLDGKIEDSKTMIGALICDAVAHRLA